MFFQRVEFHSIFFCQCIPQPDGISRFQKHEDLEPVPFWSEERSQRVGIFINFLSQLFQLLFGLVVNVQQGDMCIACYAVGLPFLLVSCRDGVEWQLFLHIVRLFRLSLADEHSDFEYELCMQPFCDVLHCFSESNFSPYITESAVCGNRNIFHLFLVCLGSALWRHEIGDNNWNGKNAFSV